MTQTHKEKAIDLLHEARDALEAFKDECEREEYTDTGDAWDVMHQAHAAIDAFLTPTKPLVDYVCQNCGGSEISVEALVQWSTAEQKFEVLDTCDKGHLCGECGETRLREVEWKPFALIIEPPGDEGECEFRFDSRAEVGAFHYGMRTGAKVGEWEVAYTDEETY